MSTPLDRYLRALDGFTGVVDGVPAAAWDAPSPCPDWSARQVLGHVIDAQRQLAGMLTGHIRPPVTDPAELARLAAEPVAAWKESRESTIAALAGVDPDATVTTPAGPAPACAVLWMVVIEPLVHSWDLATATGQPVVLDPEVVRATLPGVLGLVDQLAASGMYGKALPAVAGATEQEALLAAVGRRTGRTGLPTFDGHAWLPRSLAATRRGRCGKAGPAP